MGEVIPAQDALFGHCIPPRLGRYKPAQKKARLTCRAFNFFKIETGENNL